MENGGEGVREGVGSRVKPCGRAEQGGLGCLFQNPVEERPGLISRPDKAARGSARKSRTRFARRREEPVDDAKWRSEARTVRGCVLRSDVRRRTTEERSEKEEGSSWTVEEDVDEELRRALAASRAEATRYLRNEGLLREIAELICRGSGGVVFVTGAGLSIASGIAAFRVGDDAVWSRQVTDMGTRKMMRKEPLRWFNEFWLPTFEAKRVRDAKPSKAHKAIARVSRRVSTTRVVTQNVDGLHVGRKHGDEGVADPQLIEAHGRAGLYRCTRVRINDSNCRPCDEAVARNDWYEIDELGADDAAALIEAAETGNPISSPPKCPKCGSLAAPLALLFDECYDEHFFFEADAWDAWFDDCDGIVFVGTSFSVELTREALRRSRERRIPVFDINLCQAPPTVARADVLRKNAVIGKAEELLPKLAAFVDDLLEEMNVESPDRDRRGRATAGDDDEDDDAAAAQ